ncbi:hypothetical protein Tco_0530366 [Tanacetum coccineum]
MVIVCWFSFGGQLPMGGLATSSSAGGTVTSQQSNAATGSGPKKSKAGGSGHRRVKLVVEHRRLEDLTITFYHEGVFVGPPLEYLEGKKDTMKDLDFGNFTYGKFFECIKAATLFPHVGLFYYLPRSDLSDGIRELKNEQQLADLVAATLRNGGNIDVYVEHHGYDIHDWFAKDNDDLEDYDEDECVLDDISSFVEEPQFIGEEEVIIPNRCTSDPFLNRLCKTDPKKTTRNTFGTNEGNENALALVEDEQEDQSVDPIYKIKPGIVYPDHDPDQPWKDMVPILGMKFKDHEEMKMMLANYGVANGYQLWYKRNDYKSLLVLCGRNVEEGRCASKVGRKGIQKNVSKASKGKEKVEEGKGKEKVAEGSKVAVGNKKWTKQAIKLSKSPSKKGTKRKTSDNLCKFRLWGSWMQNEASFQIKTLIPDHNCARVFDFGALVTYKWIARHYVREIVSNPKISHRELQAAIREKFLINVSLGQVRRAKQRALYDFEGGLIEHYGKLWDYRDQLLKTNPGSTVKLDVDEVSGGKTYFKRFYVCFKAMKDGWTAGCRKVIGLDGCFLKGTIKGELLTAMGRDANNQMFPIAWAVVTVKNKDNWLWFLVSLGDDLNLNRGATVTIISDGHKGLKEAVREWLPLAEHRQCARHIYANLKKSWPGLHFKSLFWGAASATLKHVFDEKMKLLSNLNEHAHKWLVERDPNTWSRAFFHMDRSCGAFENGICESYHAAIINQRGKPIITMLEDIRIYLMQRLVIMSEKARGLTDIITPSVRKQLEKLKEYLRLWEVYPSGYREFEVRKLNAGFGVNLETHKCTCRLWDLTGIPCIHGVAAYAYLMKDPAEGVSDFYSKTAWQNCYISFIKPVSGQSMWVKTGLPPPMPPKKRVMPGRPKRKRQKHPSEVNDSSSQRVSRFGRTMTCSNCYQRGHNKKRCKNETVDPPPKEVRPKGKRKGGQNGFESAASALKRMRMDATASGSGLSEEEDADPANADHANVQEADVQQPGEMEQPVHMEEPVQEVDVQEPVQEADVQEPVLRRGLRLRRPSQRILLNKWKKPFQFDEHGTGSTAENAFDISDE